MIFTCQDSAMHYITVATKKFSVLVKCPCSMQNNERAGKTGIFFFKIAIEVKFGKLKTEVID